MKENGCCHLCADFCGDLAADGAVDGNLHGMAVPHGALGELRPADRGANLLVAGHLGVVDRHGAALLEGHRVADRPGRHVSHGPPSVAPAVLLLALLLLLLQLLLQTPLLLPPPLLLTVAEGGGSLPLSPAAAMLQKKRRKRGKYARKPKRRRGAPVSVVSAVALGLVDGVALLVVGDHRGLVAHLQAASPLHGAKCSRTPARLARPCPFRCDRRI